MTREGGLMAEVAKLRTALIAAEEAVTALARVKARVAVEGFDEVETGVRETVAYLRGMLDEAENGLLEEKWT